MGSFRAMNTDVTVIVPDADPEQSASHIARVAAVFEENERRFSRFRADSELSELHRKTGPVRVSRPLFEAFSRARAFVALTEGIFDPCIGASLIALGYDRSFAPGVLDRATSTAPVCPGSFRDVILDEVAGTVELPEGVSIDLGGMLKGRTVDEAAALLPSPSLVDAGGDGLSRGDWDGEGVVVDVEDPRDPARVLVSLRVADRAYATSAPNRRRWTSGRESRHHLVNSRTGRSATSDLAQVTVLAPSTELADVLAKTAYVLGEAAAAELLGRRDDVATVLVRLDGSIRLLGNLEVADA